MQDNTHISWNSENFFLNKSDIQNFVLGKKCAEFLIGRLDLTYVIIMKRKFLDILIFRKKILREMHTFSEDVNII